MMKADKTKKEKERLVNIKMAASLIAVSFMMLFLNIKRVDFETIYMLYDFFTDRNYVTISSSLMMLTLAFCIYKEDFSYLIVVVVFLMGQLLFVHIFADDYVLERENSAKKSLMKNKHHYTAFGNLG